MPLAPPCALRRGLVLTEMMMTEHQSGPRRLGRSLAGTRDLFDSAIARCLGSPEACEPRGRNGSHHAFAPKVVLLLIITVDEVFNCRSAHPRVNMYIFKDILVAPRFKKSFKIRSWVPSPQMPYFGGPTTSPATWKNTAGT